MILNNILLDNQEDVEQLSFRGYKWNLEWDAQLKYKKLKSTCHQQLVLAKSIG